MQSSIRYLKSVGPKKGQSFNKLGIYTREDLLYYFPVRYEDRTRFKPIQEVIPGEHAAVKGTVLVRNFRYLPGRKTIFDVILQDDSGKMKVTWFNQPYLNASIQCGDTLVVYGKAERYQNRLQFICPVFEKTADEDAEQSLAGGGTEESLRVGRIVPVYGLAGNLTQNYLRKIIHAQLPQDPGALLEPLGEELRRELRFPGVHEGLRQMHFPDSFDAIARSRERFIFEELFVAQILVYLRKARIKQAKGIIYNVRQEFMDAARANLPFQLTFSQERVLTEIMKDMSSPAPMHRLLQGDVGSGKTVIAALAMGICADNNYQAAFMVPTEVLALQHVSTLQRLYRHLPVRSLPVTIELLLGSLPPKKKQEVHRKLKEGAVDIVVGTHALLQEKVSFKQLGLVVIDEQHRFGAAQRVLLPRKGVYPDVLVMSATPIPRTLALTLYGDLDSSVIEGLPAGRKEPRTLLITEEKRAWLYQFMKERIQEGRQVYVIYPVIEDPGFFEMKAVETMYEHLKEVFKGYAVGMLHGRLSPERKFSVLTRFREQELHILVSTTVIEVGIDVPNASCMIVENPERFGLSQLHQLRGRVCRASFQPYFIMVASSSGGGAPESAFQRLSVVVHTSDGFKIAEEDLRLRGPGDFFGNFQHGFPENRIAHPLRDIKILQRARGYASTTVKKDPSLKLPDHAQLREYIKQRFFGKTQMSTDAKPHLPALPTGRQAAGRDEHR